MCVSSKPMGSTFRLGNVVPLTCIVCLPVTFDFGVDSAYQREAPVGCDVGEDDLPASVGAGEGLRVECIAVGYFVHW